MWKGSYLPERDALLFVYHHSSPLTAERCKQWPSLCYYWWWVIVVCFNPSPLSDTGCRLVLFPNPKASFPSFQRLYTDCLNHILTRLSFLGSRPFRFGGITSYWCIFGIKLTDVKTKEHWPIHLDRRGFVEIFYVLLAKSMKDLLLDSKRFRFYKNQEWLVYFEGWEREPAISAGQ